LEAPSETGVSDNEAVTYWNRRATLSTDAEPVAIYKGNGLVDCGDDGHHNVELLNLIPANTPLYAAPPAPSASEPVTSRNDEAGYVEFLNEDVPYVVRDVQGAVAILTDLETRNVIGYRVYDPDSVFAPHPAQSVAVKALQAVRDELRVDTSKGSPGSISYEVGALHRIVAAVDAALSAQVQDARSDDDEETYQIGIRDGYSQAVQEIDRLTGGDGEYRYCTDHDPERHTPGPAEMIQRIVDRFETLNLIGEAEKRGDFWDAPGSAQVQDVAGWMLVPIEPTEEMKKAGREEAEDCEDVYGSAIYSTAEIYRAMLAAAPAKQEG